VTNSVLEQNCIYSASKKYLDMWNKPVVGFACFTWMTVIHRAGTFYLLPVK